MSLEIERKWRLSRVPLDLLPWDAGKPIDQGYVFSGDSGTLRVRQKGDRYSLTVKEPGGLSRREWDVPIEPWVFMVIWPRTAGRRLTKRRHTCFENSCVRPDGGWGAGTLELDVYNGSLAGLVVLEREFASEEEAIRYTLPIDLVPIATEVTGDPRYGNDALALSDRIPDDESRRTEGCDRPDYCVICDGKAGA